MRRLEKKIALVTGAAQGIGEAIASAFVMHGAIVFLTDINEEGGLKTAKILGERAKFAKLDVCDESDWINVVRRVISSFGRLDVLVNNAATTGFNLAESGQDPEHITLENWRAIHRTNLDGVFLGCKYAIQFMKSSGGGSIINIASRSGVVGIPYAAAYASSKAAVRNLTKSVALYCAAEGLNIRCNCIQPAGILTAMWDPILGEGPERERRMQNIVEGIPLRRFGKADEVAAVAVLLASDECPYMTGSEITIDGGILSGTTASPKPATP